MPCRRRPLLLAAAAMLLTACGAGAQAQAPDWKPQPSFQGEGPQVSISPILPAQPGPQQGPPGGNAAPTPGTGPQGGSSAPAPDTGPATGSPSPSRTPTADPAVVAEHLRSPVGLTLLPDGTALVGERGTGRIVRVQPDPGRPVTPVRTLTGLSTTGGGGLLDLALSPFYAQDGLIYAYLTTAKDNRVVAFTLTGPVTPVVTGIPRGGSDNAGRIAFAHDGDLYIATGDAGHPKTASQMRSLAGKVLRVSDIGTPAKHNPVPDSPVYTSGHHDPSGLCLDPDTGTVFEVEDDEINLLAPGATYGWPRASQGDHPSLAILPTADQGPGGCAVLNGVLYVSSLDGHALLAASIRTQGSSVGLGKFTTSLVNKYGRLRTVVAAADGALWLTTSNRDGHGTPVPADERVLRITPPSGGGGGGVT